MSPLAQELEVAVDAWRRRGWPAPDVLLVTGSTGAVEPPGRLLESLPLAELLPFPVHAIEGHSLDARLVELCEDRHLLYLRGRLHCYQGFDPAEVVFGVRLARLLGAGLALLTNAAGSLRPDRGPGTLSLVADHLNLSGLTPLSGELPASWGPRFPPLNDAYDEDLRALAGEVAAKLGIALEDGVYAWVQGPSYETPAEVRMLAGLGADLVGMSTVPEVLAARHMGMRCLAVSLVTNLAAGLTEEMPSHEEVVAEGRLAAEKTEALLSALLLHERLTTTD